MCGVAHSRVTHVWHVSFMVIHAWHVSFVIFTCDVTHSHVCHDSCVHVAFKSVACLIRMCDMFVHATPHTFTTNTVSTKVYSTDDAVAVCVAVCVALTADSHQSLCLIFVHTTLKKFTINIGDFCDVLGGVHGGALDQSGSRTWGRACPQRSLVS